MKTQNGVGVKGGGPNVERWGGSRMGIINIVRVSRRLHTNTAYVRLSTFNKPSCGACQPSAGDAFTETRTTLTVPPFRFFFSSFIFIFLFSHLDILDGQNGKPKLV